MRSAAFLPCWWWWRAGTCSRRRQLESKTPAAADAQRNAPQTTRRGGTDVHCHGDRTAHRGGLRHHTSLQNKTRRANVLNLKQEDMTEISKTRCFSMKRLSIKVKLIKVGYEYVHFEGCHWRSGRTFSPLTSVHSRTCPFWGVRI